MATNKRDPVIVKGNAINSLAIIFNAGNQYNKADPHLFGHISYNTYLSFNRCPPTTTRRPQVSSTRRPVAPRRNNQVKCFTCGSLFSTDAPDCDTFDPANPAQRTTCGPDEACLWYSFVQAPGEPREVIRECFSTGILLGTIDDPIEARSDCRPKNVENDDSITACMCTEDYCNGYESDEEKASNQNQLATKRPSRIQPTTSRQSFNQVATTTERPRSQSGRPPPRTNAVASSDPDVRKYHNWLSIYIVP